MFVFEKYFKKLIASLYFQNIFFKFHILDKKNYEFAQCLTYSFFQELSNIRIVKIPSFKPGLVLDWFQ